MITNFYGRHNVIMSVSGRVKWSSSFALGSGKDVRNDRVNTVPFFCRLG
jgi:hypothetical protein